MALSTHDNVSTNTLSVEVKEEKNMAQNVFHNVLSYVIVNLVLLVIYLYAFGQHSIQKYLTKAVIITEMEERPSSITPPGNF